MHCISYPCAPTNVKSSQAQLDSNWLYTGTQITIKPTKNKQESAMIPVLSFMSWRFCDKLNCQFCQTSNGFETKKGVTICVMCWRKYWFRWVAMYILHSMHDIFINKIHFTFGPKTAKMMDLFSFIAIGEMKHNMNKYFSYVYMYM